MRLKLISCDMFESEVKAAAARSSNYIEFEFLPQSPHQLSRQKKLACVQALIDDADRTRFHAVLLAAGSCKKGLAGLRAGSIPLVVPRAKDCISLLLQRPKPARQSPVHQAQATAAPAGPRQASGPHAASHSRAWLLPMAAPGVPRSRRSALPGHTWRLRERFGPPPGLIAGSVGRPRGQTCSLLEMLVNGYWNYTDFLVVAPGWRVVIHNEGTLAAEE